MELPRSIYQSIRTYKEIEMDGLVLWPVRVYEYDDFSAARPALEVMHQSLPVALMRMPLLSALYRMDYEMAIQGKPPTGLFSRALLVLALSLRLGEGEEMEERVKLFQVVVDREEPEKLISLRTMGRDGEIIEIKPELYQKLRPIIAAQNGVKIESDLANPDIVKAKKAMASAGAVQLDAKIEDLISAVATLSGTDEAEIEEWPILKLENRSRAYQRILSYLVCGIGEVQGTTWKTGNPTPHPFFAKKDTGGGLFTAMGEKQDSTPASVRKIIETTKDL